MQGPRPSLHENDLIVDRVCIRLDEAFGVHLGLASLKLYAPRRGPAIDPLRACVKNGSDLEELSVKWKCAQLHGPGERGEDVEAKKHSGKSVFGIVLRPTVCHRENKSKQSEEEAVE